MKEILDEISVRFIIPLSKEDLEQNERLYFMIEEAYWFYLDFYRGKKMPFVVFSQKILEHNGMKFDENDCKNFAKYKKQIPVFGSIILNQKFDKILLVKGYFHNQFFFPKGKKNKDESPKDCAIREIFEEIGYDIENKILEKGVKISKNFVLYVVLNVNEHIEFKTRTRNEIKEIKWISVNDILRGKRDDLKQVNGIFSKCYNVIKEIQNERFRFNYSKINSIIEQRLKNFN